jgi:long-chain acyl-CoA synthetase
MEQLGKYRNINTILSEQAKRYGRKVYITNPDQEKSVSFAQTAHWCNRIANYLKQQGIRPSEKISLVGENTIETLLLFLGVLNYGATICPINVEESKENVYRVLNHAKPIIVFHGEDLTFDKARYPADLWVPYSYSGINGGRKGELFSSLKKYSPVFNSPVGAKDDLATLVFTSGTTSTPKGVVSTRESFYYMHLDTIDRLKITDRDVILDYRAYNWNSPQILSIMPSLFTGATLVYARGFSRSRFPQWLKKYGVTICVGVPTVINMLLEREVELHKRDIPSLRFMTSSSAPLLVRNQLAFEEKYGIPINQQAGSSETAWMALNDPEDFMHPEARKFGSIGKPPRYKEVLILDDDGKRLGPSEEGELVIRGKSMGLGYLWEDGSISKFPADGFHTGDLGYVDKDGYVFITGRKKDQIIRGGVKISPLEITSWLMEHPAVLEAVTIGVPDKIYGEDVASFIIAKEGQTISQEVIISHCKNKLPDFKLPKTVCFVSDFPKTHSGKVVKRELVKIWEEMQAKTA